MDSETAWLHSCDRVINYYIYCCDLKTNCKCMMLTQALNLANTDSVMPL